MDYDIVISMYDVRGVVNLMGLSLCEVCKCLTIMFFCTPEANKHFKTILMYYLISNSTNIQYFEKIFHIATNPYW